jgi:hypothetical protein
MMRGGEVEGKRRVVGCDQYICVWKNYIEFHQHVQLKKKTGSKMYPVLVSWGLSGC